MADGDTHPSYPAETTFTTATVDVEQSGRKKKQPKRILHFSDGILEEYSSDESEEESTDIQTKVDPKMLAWTPWCIYYITLAAQKSLSAADFCGEKLAWFFGITTPKYRYAIEEYNRMQKEVQSELAKEQKVPEEAQSLATIDVQVVDGKNSSNEQTSSIFTGDAKAAGKY